MGHGIVGRATALAAMTLIGFSPAFGAHRQAGGESHWEAGVRSSAVCPTRFDYVVLASFGHGLGVLSLSSYRFRSQTGFSRIPLTGFQRVAFTWEPAASNCRSRRPSSPGQVG
jgi:hypothetical protein